jgi:hypothetical protein
MPYLTCPTCRLEAYSAAGYATTDRCSRCEAFLTTAEQAPGVLRRWKVADLRLATRREAEHEFG